MQLFGRVPGMAGTMDPAYLEQFAGSPFTQLVNGRASKHRVDIGVQPWMSTEAGERFMPETSPHHVRRSISTSTLLGGVEMFSHICAPGLAC